MELIDATNDLMPEGLQAGTEDIANFKLNRKRYLCQGIRSVYKELHADHETGLLTTKKAEYQAPGKCEIFSLFCCPGFPKGVLWHTTLLAKCSVLYALSALPLQMPLPPGRARAFEAAGK